MHRGITANQMAKRILDRGGHIYNKKTIQDILNMYMEECGKALLKGEQVQISRVCTIIPEVKTREGGFNLPVCNKEGGNPPYTRLRLRRNNSFVTEMNRTLLDNIRNGTLGLENTPFNKQQIGILKNSGYLSEDVNETDNKGE